MNRWFLVAACGAACTVAVALHKEKTLPKLLDPIQVKAGDKPITVDVGHSAPCLADLDGDGTQELLVGQFGDGKLRIYRNEGTAGEPRFEKFSWFQAGGKTASVPSG